MNRSTCLTLTFGAFTALFLTSCQSSGDRTRTSASRYLPYEMANPASLGATKTDASPIPDSVSYWDGNAVRGEPKVVIDVSDQKAYFYRDHHIVGVSKISSGKDGFDTPLGDFKITQKNIDHKSNLYGNYVYPDGTIAVKDVDVTKDPQPPGTRFDGAPMPYFMRFHGGVGMHAGFLPGFAASHGCVRMPDRMAEIYFRNVELGTPVSVRR